MTEDVTKVAAREMVGYVAAAVRNDQPAMDVMRSSVLARSGEELQLAIDLIVGLGKAAILGSNPGADPEFVARRWTLGAQWVIETGQVPGGYGSL